MKIKHTSNGNLHGEQYDKLISTVLINPESRDWAAVNELNSLQSFDNRREYVRCIPKINSQTIDSSLLNNFVNQVVSSNETSQLVCNKQYRLNKDLDGNFTNLCHQGNELNLEVSAETLASSTGCVDDLRNITNSFDEQTSFRTPDPDEMHERVKGAPRGIVNPNYPGFQHLAHTLQDYSSTIENFYQSENDMTDDDVDVEITDLTYDTEPKIDDMSTKVEFINNNNDNSVKSLNKILMNESASTCENKIDKKTCDVPDLIKTVTQNTNSVDEFSDIENNFRTQDIIGDFNKEIEDEIKNVLNYNLNIDDDLEELRKDIKNNFEEPIVNTINHISDVVNHVIKKLVETHSEDIEIDPREQILTTDIINEKSENKINELFESKEVDRNRPKFVYIEENNSIITDAFLSDGKEDINICEQDYETDKLANDVENTLKQLSTELRKIIPKLDEMRERDKIFALNMNSEPSLIVTDSNCNQVLGSQDFRSCLSKGFSEYSSEQHHKTPPFFQNPTYEIIKRSNSKTLRDCAKQSSRGSFRTQSYASVQNNELKEECYQGSFDVYNIETALPKIDLDAIENHLKAAKEAERRKRNDREEIRRRLAMGAENDENYYSLGHIDRPGRKPSLQSRLQSGMNLQICFMNETASENESQLTEIENSLNRTDINLSKSSIFSKSNYSLNNHPYQTRPLSVSISKQDKNSSTEQTGAKLRPSSLSLKTSKSRSSNSLGHIELRESDFKALQATLQTEARIALASAKELARVQMERERHTRAVSPVTEMLRRSMEKANAPLPADRRRVSRHILTDMNIAQLQVIVNELHSQIEALNESLVARLMARDELHMRQDSMLVDIEDLTRYLGVKEQTKKTKGTNKSAVRRLASFVSKQA